MNYQRKLMSGGRDNSYLCFYMPKEIVDKYHMKKGEKVTIVDDGNIILVLNKKPV